MDYQKLLNKNIKKLRQKSGLTQESFAEKIGVSIQGLSNIERNRYQPNAETINKICKAFDIKPQELLLQDINTDEDILNDINILLKTCSNAKLKKIHEVIKMLVKL